MRVLAVTMFFVAAASAIAVPAAGEGDAVVAELNHLYVTLQRETVEAIASSQFLRERFAIVQTQTVNTPAESWTGTYLFGWTAYLELFAPGGAEGTVEGASGIGFSVPRLGSGRAIKDRLDAVPGEVASSSLVSARLDDKTNIPWFDAISLKSLESQAFSAWLMDFRPEIAAHRKIAMSDSNLVERHAYLAAINAVPEKKAAYEAVAFDDIVEVRMELGEAEAASFGRFVEALGWSAATDGSKRTLRSGTFTIVVTAPPAPTYRIRTVVCSLRRDAGPAVEQAFGPDGQLRLEGRTATWTFGPR